MTHRSATGSLLAAVLPDVQTFFDSHGHLVIAGGAVLLGLILLLVAYRLLFSGRRKTAPEEPDLTEDLAAYPPPPALWGDQRLTVHGLAARLRLVVTAPLGHEGATIHAADIEPFLNVIVPGLGTAARADKPQVRTWPMQLSHQGFIASFRRHAIVPEERGPSRWVLLMGRVLLQRRPVALGIALLANQDNTLGKITLEHPHQWAEAIRVKQA